MKSFFLTLLTFLSTTSLWAELEPLDIETLENTRAQSGVEIDIDLSDFELVYSYTNTENPNENFWIAGVDPGGDLIKINGLSIDAVATPQGSALAIGLPSSVELDNVNTGDWFVAHPSPDLDNTGRLGPPIIDTNTSDGANNAPTGQIPVEQQTKLLGLRWNAPADLTTGNATIDNYDYSTQQINMTGRVLVFGAP